MSEEQASLASCTQIRIATEMRPLKLRSDARYPSGLCTQSMKTQNLYHSNQAIRDASIENFSYAERVPAQHALLKHYCIHVEPNIATVSITRFRRNKNDFHNSAHHTRAPLLTTLFQHSPDDFDAVLQKWRFHAVWAAAMKTAVSVFSVSSNW